MKVDIQTDNDTKLTEELQVEQMAVDTLLPPEIPVVSLVTSTPDDVLRALSTVGFILLEIEGTGITQVDIDRAFELSGLFHSVPVDERTPFLIDNRGNGYLGMKGSLDERKSGRTDLKESFVWGRFKATEDETGTTQVLPHCIQKHRQEIEAFDKKCFEASLRVLDILSCAFDVIMSRSEIQVRCSPKLLTFSMTTSYLRTSFVPPIRMPDRMRSPF